MHPNCCCRAKLNPLKNSLSMTVGVVVIPVVKLTMKEGMEHNIISVTILTANKETGRKRNPNTHTHTHTLTHTGKCTWPRLVNEQKTVRWTPNAFGQCSLKFGFRLERASVHDHQNYAGLKHDSSKAPAIDSCEMHHCF